MNHALPPFTTLFIYYLHVSVFFAPYLSRPLVLNLNDEIVGSTLCNYSQKIKLHIVYTLNMMIHSQMSNDDIQRSTNFD